MVVKVVEVVEVVVVVEVVELGRSGGSGRWVLSGLVWKALNPTLSESE